MCEVASRLQLVGGVVIHRTCVKSRLFSFSQTVGGLDHTACSASCTTNHRDRAHALQRSGAKITLAQIFSQARRAWPLHDHFRHRYARCWELWELASDVNQTQGVHKSTQNVGSLRGCELWEATFTFISSRAAFLKAKNVNVVGFLHYAASFGASNDDFNRKNQSSSVNTTVLALFFAIFALIECIGTQTRIGLLLNL